MSEIEIRIPTDPKIKEDDLHYGLISQATWERILPALTEFFKLNEDEKIVGIIVTKEKIKIKIRSKK